MSEVNFEISSIDAHLVDKICDRVANLLHVDDRMSLEMDIVACHLNGCPLDLEKLLAADDFNLIHDVGGIRQHMDRNTGKLMDCFLPRCAKKVKAMK